MTNVDSRKLGYLLLPLMMAWVVVFFALSFRPSSVPSSKCSDHAPAKEEPRVVHAVDRTKEHVPEPRTAPKLAKFEGFSWTGGFPLQGQDLFSLRAQDAGECAEACARVPGEACEGFSFSGGTGSCVLKRVFDSGVGDLTSRDLSAAVRVRGGFVRRDVGKGIHNGTMAKEWLPGANDEYRCAGACDWRDGDCSGYVYDRSKESTGNACALLTSKRNSNDISGVR